MYHLFIIIYSFPKVHNYLVLVISPFFFSWSPKWGLDRQEGIEQDRKKTVQDSLSGILLVLSRNVQQQSMLARDKVCKVRDMRWNGLLLTVFGALFPLRCLWSCILYTVSVIIYLLFIHVFVLLSYNTFWLQFPISPLPPVSPPPFLLPQMYSFSLLHFPREKNRSPRYSNQTQHNKTK